MGKKGRHESPKRLGAKLVSIRNSLGLSQNGMLRHLEIGEEYTREELSAYERGVRTPPLHILLKYSKAVRVWVNVLIDDELNLPTELPSRSMHEGIPRSLLKRRSENSPSKS
jgi:transcriptional regulator with XRE-family HTH domain